jgi:hypothetical protein
MFKMMTQDLNRYFNLNAGIQQRMVKCLVLIRTSRIDKLKTKGGVIKDNFRSEQKRVGPIDSIRYLTNKPFTIFVERIAAKTQYGFHKPFRDSTGYSGNIDVEMDGRILDNIDLNALRKELNKYDLALVEKYCPLNVLVLRDNNQIE